MQKDNTKRKYVDVEMEIVTFAFEDVLYSSGLDAITYDYKINNDGYDAPEPGPDPADDALW